MGRPKVYIKIGDRFNRLLVKRSKGIDKKGQYLWECACNCGNIKMYTSSTLKSGKLLSCGCLQKELTSKRFKTHGRHGDSIYRIWSNMCSRVRNKKIKAYKNYGGRGITVCKEWNKFENFLNDMGERPDGKFLDRIDNNGNYCKENCRWATRFENNNNMRTNIIIDFKGKKQTLSLWALELNIKKKALEDRIFKLKWSIEDAFSVTYPCKIPLRNVKKQTK